MFENYPIINGQHGRLVALESGASPQAQIDATIAKFRDELDRDNDGNIVTHAGSGTRLSERLYQEAYWLDNEEPDENGDLPPPHYRVGVSFDSDATPSTVTQLRLWVGVKKDSARDASMPSVTADNQALDSVFARMAP